MTPRKKHYLDVWDMIDDCWVTNFETYQFGEMRRKYIQLLKEGYDVQYRHEYPDPPEEK